MGTEKHRGNRKRREGIRDAGRVLRGVPAGEGAGGHQRMGLPAHSPSLNTPLTQKQNSIS